jgi:hypothetical protein
MDKVRPESQSEHTPVRLVLKLYTTAPVFQRSTYLIKPTPTIVQPPDHRSGCPMRWWPSSPRGCLAGRPEKREYLRQFGIHPGNPG